MSGKIGILKIGMAVGLGGITKGMNQASQVVQGFTSKLAGVGGSAVNAFSKIGLAVQGVKAVMAGLSTPFQLVSDLEQASAAFEVLTGSGEAAAQMIASINTMAAKTSVGGAASLQKAARTMLGFGVATEQVLPIMSNLSKFAAGSADRFDSLALVMSQVSAATKLNAADANQFISAGVPIWKLLSESIGKSVAEIRKMSEAGEISFDMVNTAITKATTGSGKYADMNEKIANTMGGVWGQLTSKATLAFTKISQTIFKALRITEFLKWASSMIDVVVPYIESFVSMVAGFMGQIRFNTKPVLDWLYQRWVFVSGVIGSVVDKVKGVVVGAFNAICNGITAMFPIWQGFSNVAGAVLLFITDLVVGFATMIGTVFTYVSDWIGTNIVSWKDFSAFIVDAFNVIEFSFLNWKDVLVYVGFQIAACVVKWINDFIWFGENMVLQIWGAINIGKDLFLAMAGWYLTIFENLSSNIVAIWQNLGPLMRGEMDFKDIWKPLTDGFAMEISKLPELTKREMGSVEKSMNDTVDGLASKLGKGYDEFLAKKDKMNALKMPEWKLPTAPDMQMNTQTAQAATDVAKPAESTIAKLGDKAQIGTKEGRDALIKHQMGALDKSTPEKSAKDTAANTAEVAKQQKETNRLLRESNKNMNNQVTDTTVSFV